MKINITYLGNELEVIGNYIAEESNNGIYQGFDIDNIIYSNTDVMNLFLSINIESICEIEELCLEKMVE